MLSFTYKKVFFDCSTLKWTAYCIHLNQQRMSLSHSKFLLTHYHVTLTLVTLCFLCHTSGHTAHSFSWLHSLSMRSILSFLPYIFVSPTIFLYPTSPIIYPISLCLHPLSYTSCTTPVSMFYCTLEVAHLLYF